MPKLVILYTSMFHLLLKIIIKVDLEPFRLFLCSWIFRISQQSKSNTIYHVFSQHHFVTTTTIKIQYSSFSGFQIHSFQLLSLPLDYPEPTVDSAWKNLLFILNTFGCLPFSGACEQMSLVSCLIRGALLDSPLKYQK